MSSATKHPVPPARSALVDDDPLPRWAAAVTMLIASTIMLLVMAV